MFVFLAITTCLRRIKFAIKVNYKWIIRDFTRDFAEFFVKIDEIIASSIKKFPQGFLCGKNQFCGL